MNLKIVCVVSGMSHAFNIQVCLLKVLPLNGNYTNLMFTKLRSFQLACVLLIYRHPLPLQLLRICSNVAVLLISSSCKMLTLKFCSIYHLPSTAFLFNLAFPLTHTSALAAEASLTPTENPMSYPEVSRRLQLYLFICLFVCLFICYKLFIKLIFFSTLLSE